MMCFGEERFDENQDEIRMRSEFDVGSAGEDAVMTGDDGVGMAV